MPETLIRELTTGDFFALDRNAGELFLIDKHHVEEFKKSGGDMKAARDLVRRGNARSFDSRTIQKLQAALIHIQVLI